MLPALNISSIAVPTLARTWGYTKRSFHDHFESTATIDMADAGLNGKNWYLRNAWPAPAGIDVTENNNIINAAAISADDIAVAGSVLTLTDDTNIAVTVLASTCYSATDPRGYAGQTFSGGAYFEGRFKCNPSQSPGSHPTVATWPSWWSLANQKFTGTQAHYEEADFFELFPQGEGSATTLLGGMHDTDRSVDPLVDIPSTNFNQGGAIVENTWFKIGCLWVPMSRNGGTGLYKRYFNDANDADGDVSWTSGQAHSLLDIASLQMRLNSGPGWPLYCDYISVWQAP